MLGSCGVMPAWANSTSLSANAHYELLISLLCSGYNSATSLQQYREKKLSLNMNDAHIRSITYAEQSFQ